MRHSLIWRTTGFFFVFCAFVQWNDPDPWLWIAVYMLAFVMMELAYRGIFYPSISLVFFFIGMAGAISLFPSDFQGLFGEMRTDNHIEEARESFGLILISISQMYIFLCTKSKENTV